MVERLSLYDCSLLSGYAEFMQQYDFASAYCRGKRVIDAGCGTGCGSNLLARSAERVLGVDISPLAISEATNLYNRANLSFAVADLESLDCNDTDIVVNVGVLPHLKHPARFLKRVPALITTTPNNPVPTTYAFHHHFFSESGFRQLLEEHFKDITFYGQWLTPDGRLRKKRGKEWFDQFCASYYCPSARVGRLVLKIFGKKIVPPPQATHEADSFAGDHVISPLSDPPFPWGPSTFIGVCFK